MSNRTDSGGGVVEGPDHQVSASDTVLDPVCGMEISREDAVGSYVHEGQEYFFCHPSCLEKFRANPGQYLSLVQASGAKARGEPQRSFVVPKSGTPQDDRLTTQGRKPDLHLPHGSRSTPARQGPMSSLWDRHRAVLSPIHNQAHRSTSAAPP